MKMPTKTKKNFTQKEANKRLPLVSQIVGDIIALGKEFRDIMKQESGNQIPARCYDIKNEIEVLIMELEDIGCYYKDWNFEIGLVDFPAIIDGKQVFLCWRSDEKEIAWFHSLEEGYSGRKLIPEELLI